MARFSNADLIAKALVALDDVYSRAREGPIERTAELRFLLTFLAQNAAERWPHDLFYREAIRAPGHTDAEQFGRRQSLTAGRNGIRVQMER
jgi:hypothetical protein